ncbi:MAG TPA: tRNA (N6-isopentenyl adenosine(37)-C2)-methylthiotransferase MiaB [Anaerolineales bacterium]|nr:tRNA (N6-isopentenyl adenosine(37)-C2)-methylthiotransferase MiaB [Anaerolineales bacterium]
MKYHVWTEGCQMNVADSQRVSAALEGLGYTPCGVAEDADVIVLNTCVVRQSAEDRAYGRLTTLRPLKERRPEVVINLMGCLVGLKGNAALEKAFPFVDVFSPPSDPSPLVAHLTGAVGRELTAADVSRRNAALDGDWMLPLAERGRLVSAHVPIVYGCSHACTFCIIPYRRGPERSRPVGEIAAEARSLVRQGVREITLLGQIVDRYGMDVPDGPHLPDLLRALHHIDGLERIRFLTSHPNWMTDELLDAVASLPKVCEHIEVPVQAGDDAVLSRMRRGYTADDYRRLVERIRRRVPGASIGTDIIVGFPGESEAQFQRTYDLLAELRLDVAHLARYSPRPGTVAARRMDDDVPQEEKDRRFRALEDLQASILDDLNRAYMGRSVEVLVEERHRERWKGRTRTNRLVFFESAEDVRGRLLPVRVDWAGPWSLVGTPIRIDAQVEAALVA